MDWKYRRSAFRRPPAQLEQVEATIRFFEDRVEAEGVLHLRAREPMAEIALDCDGATRVYPLDRAYAAGECRIRTTRASRASTAMSRRPARRSST